MNKSRILIVEDEVVVAMDIEARLRSMGYTVVGRVDTGEAAITTAAERRPDLVLMDIRLKGVIDGIDAANVVRKESEIPVVFLTAHADERTLDRAKLSEPFGYILKPFDDRDLRAVVEMALYRQRADLEIRRVNRLYAVLSQVNRALVQVRSIPEFLEEVCRVTVEAGGVSFCWVGQHHPRGRTLESAASWGSVACDEGISVDESEPPRCACARAFCEQRLVVAAMEAGTAEEGRCPRAPSQGRLDVAVIPLKVRGTRWGVFSVYSLRSGVFGRRELALLEEVAAAIAFGVEHLGREEERERAEAEVREQRRLFETLVEVIPAPVFVQDTGGRYVRCNDAFARFLGRPREEILHRGADEVVSPEDTNRSWHADDQIFHLGRGGVHRLTSRVSDASGNRRDVVFHRAALCSAEGVPIGIVGVILDITELKEHERELAASEGRYRALFETALDGFSVAELQYDGSPARYIEVNQALCRLLGVTRDEYLSGAPLTREDREGSAEWGRRAARLKESGCLRFETRLLRRDGRTVPVEVSAHVFESGGRRFMLELVREGGGAPRADVGPAEPRQREAARLFAGAVAHDMNEILAAMLMNVGLLGAGGNLHGEPAEALTELERLGQKATEFTRELVLLSRRQASQLAHVDLNALVSGTARRLKTVLGPGIEIVLDCAPQPLWADVDPGLIELALTNLGLNGRDAMPSGGRLVLGTERLEPGALKPADSRGELRGSHACLRVVDQGSGMDEATLGRVFDPHFTTKDGGRGTGLGLPIALGIIEQHGGWIEVSSVVGKGTTLRMLLPLTRAVTVSSAAPAEPLKSAEPRPVTVLLVEDTASVRRMVSLTLRGMGYRVLEAENAPAALEIWARETEATDILLTDMVMPGGMSGLELIERMREVRPGLPAVITSGYSMELTREGRPRFEGVGYLPKPYHADALAQVLKDQLAAAGRPVE